MKDAPGIPTRSAAQFLSAVKAFEREGEFFKAFDQYVASAPVAD